jgi:hypothetical protein
MRGLNGDQLILVNNWLEVGLRMFPRMYRLLFPEP